MVFGVERCGRWKRNPRDLQSALRGNPFARFDEAREGVDRQMAALDALLCHHARCRSALAVGSIILRKHGPVAWPAIPDRAWRQAHSFMKKACAVPLAYESFRQVPVKSFELAGRGEGVVRWWKAERRSCNFSPPPCVL